MPEAEFLRWTCACGKALKAPVAAAGKGFTCGKCEKKGKIPAASVTSVNEETPPIQQEREVPLRRWIALGGLFLTSVGLLFTLIKPTWVAIVLVIAGGIPAAVGTYPEWSDRAHEWMSRVRGWLSRAAERRRERKRIRAEQAAADRAFPNPVHFDPPEVPRPTVDRPVIVSSPLPPPVRTEIRIVHVSLGRDDALSATDYMESRPRNRPLIRNRGRAVFENPLHAGHARITRGGAWVMCFLFGPLYLFCRGCYIHTIASFFAALMTLGISWLLYPFFAYQIVCESYLARGWNRVG